MSRGLGVLQRRVCAVLYAADGGLPLRELRRRLGEPDRSNLRRAIRGLLDREIVVESRQGGEPRAALTVWSYIGMSGRLASPEGRRAFIAGPTGRGRLAWDGSKTGRRRRQARTGEGPAGSRQGQYRPVHNRPLSETQKRILGALNRHRRSSQQGLPVTLVKVLVDADRSNLRRAVRTLLVRGLLEELDDGRRIRLSPSGVDAASGLS